MTDWAKAKLGDYLRLKHGYAFKSAFFVEQSDLIVVTPGNFFDDGGFKHKGDKEKFYDGPVPDGFMLDRGDLIVAMTEQAEGLLGSPAVIPEDAKYLHNQRLGKVIELDEANLDKQFLYYLFNLRTVRAQIRATANGAKVRHTSPARIYDVEVSLPQLATQQRIASILAAYDDLIENNTRRIAILEEMARRLYEEWFVHFRFPGHEEVEFDGELPIGWKASVVSESVKRFTTGKKFDQKTVQASGSVPVLDQGKSGIIGYHDEEPGFQASSEDPVVVFANHTCYQRLVMFPFSSIQNVIPFKSSDQFPRNIYWLHHATLGLVELNDYKGHWPQFAAKEISIPPLELSDNFGSKVAPLHQQIRLLQVKNGNLRAQRDLLLPKLVSGEIDVSEAENAMEAAE